MVMVKNNHYSTAEVMPPLIWSILNHFLIKQKPVILQLLVDFVHKTGEIYKTKE